MSKRNKVALAGFLVAVAFGGLFRVDSELGRWALDVVVTGGFVAAFLRFVSTMTEDL